MKGIKEQPVWTVHVSVMPKAGVNDPEGEAILGGLRSLGFAQVERVRAGREFTLQVRAESMASARGEAEEMARRLLSNPVIEEFAIELDHGFAEGFAV